MINQTVIHSTPPVPGTLPVPMITNPEATMITNTPTPQAPTHSVGQGVSLLKPVGVEYAPETATQPRRLPPVGDTLHSHRYGLRMNDPVVLHSALVILALRGGTAHQTALVHTATNCQACAPILK